MADAFRQLSFTEKTLAKGHFLFAFEYLIEIILDFTDAPNPIFSNSVTKLFQAEFDVMEIRDNLANRLIQI